MSGNPLNLIFGLAGVLLKPFGGGKSKPAPKPAPVPTRIEARERAERSDILSRRRGTDANRRVTGRGSGEALTGPKRGLLGRS